MDIDNLKSLYYRTFNKEAPNYYLISNTEEYKEMLEYCIDNEIEINDEIEEKFLGNLNSDLITSQEEIDDNEETFSINKLFNLGE